MVTALVLILTIGVGHQEEPPAAASPPAPTLAAQEPKPQPGVAAPRAGLAAPVDRPKMSDQAELDAWSLRVSAKTKVPARVLAAYGRAEMWMRGQKPSCHLSWATLAGVGGVEAARFDGTQIGPDGRVAKPIVGPALNGAGGATAVHDTDAGKLDGDLLWDHLVGPLRFAPATWVKYAERASGDGAPADPQNIDDGAFTAARRLCAGGDDLGTPAGWWKALPAYNPATPYAQDVFTGADSYAEASTTP
ncbi:murein transglycosylase [Amycolatopsis sp. H20-H5]|nr:murein transglycosylase [Amycolatopsis sp. H20-H5]MEC3975965.1 murein transglycosylase [Amycolatopsis sp. H20-H5]